MSGATSKIIAMPRFLGGRITREPTYRFQDGEATTVPVETNMETLAKRIEKANRALQVEQTMLREAQDHVVVCEGEVMKAQIALEKEQDAWRKIAEERGLPCG